MTSLYLSTLNFKLSTITMTMAVDDDGGQLKVEG